jgi:hypothetical protein
MTSSNVYGQIIAADKIEFNPKSNSTSLIQVRNYLELSLIPSVAIVDILVKLRFDKEASFPLWILVKNPESEVVFSYEHPEPIQNIREAQMDPGIDLALNSRFLVNMEGTYYIELLADRSILSDYPVYVRCVK